MKRLLLAALLALSASSAFAQTCPTRPPGTIGNACASVDFVGAAVAAAVPALPNADIFVGNSSNVAAAVAMSGDCTISNAGLITCTKTSGVTFATLATKASPVCSDLTNSSPSCSTDATNAANISSGTLNALRLPAFGSADVSCAAGGGACTIAANAVTNAKLAQAGANTMKGNWTGSTANVADNAMPSCSDTGGNHLNYVSGTGITCGTSSSGGALGAITVQRFISGTSLTYTPTGGTSRAHIRMPGGGGGGGAQNTNAGGNGTDTSFGTWTAIHGNGGGTANAAGGAGGTGGVNGTGTLVNRVTGGAGMSCVGSAPGGIGGNNPFSGAGANGLSSTAGQSAAANSGAGGQGGGNAAGTCGSGGGAGEYVEFWMTAAQIGASQTYTVGGGGNGGAAGTQAGGAGAAGVIIVEEYPF